MIFSVAKILPYYDEFNIAEFMNHVFTGPNLSTGKNWSV